MQKRKWNHFIELPPASFGANYIRNTNTVK